MLEVVGVALQRDLIMFPDLRFPHGIAQHSGLAFDLLSIQSTR